MWNDCPHPYTTLQYMGILKWTLYMHSKAVGADIYLLDRSQWVKNAS